MRWESRILIRKAINIFSRLCTNSRTTATCHFHLSSTFIGQYMTDCSYNTLFHSKTTHRSISGKCIWECSDIWFISRHGLLWSCYHPCSWCSGQKQLTESIVECLINWCFKSFVKCVGRKKWLVVVVHHSFKGISHLKALLKWLHMISSTKNGLGHQVLHRTV